MRSPIRPEFARSLNLWDLIHQEGHDPTHSGYKDSRSTRFAILKPGSSNAGSVWQQFSAGYGIEVRDPTLDKRVT